MSVSMRARRGSGQSPENYNRLTDGAKKVLERTESTLREQPGDDAMRKSLIVLMLLLCAAGCSPTASEVIDLGRWASMARQSCRTSGACPEPRACIVAVEEATRPASGRVAFQRASALCWPYRVD
jgi:hypothetical protein